ncbi:MAG TPA: 5'-methylthioadenosine/adenosylhomocysteine nucleosidase [Acidimicrobiia bacterium]|nr:5'-methylthioadenosine/adenosylhomocysteine nucleosidase [Acidimicrobiia bacterium]
MKTHSEPIAIVTALHAELAELRSGLELDQESDLLGRYFARGYLEGRPVVISEGGIGKVNAAVTATALVHRFDCRKLVFTGVAGGLDPDLVVGDVVIAEETIQYDFGVATDAGLERYQPGHLPFFNPTARFGYRPSSRLLAIVRRRMEGFSLAPLSSQAGGTGRPPRIVFGTVLTADQFVNSEETRRRLWEELGGAAVEMEGAALAQTAEVLGVDHVVIRSLSDRAGTESIRDFSRFLEEVAANSVRVVRHLLPVI